MKSANDQEGILAPKIPLLISQKPQEDLKELIVILNLRRITKFDFEPFKQNAEWAEKLIWLKNKRVRQNMVR